MSRTGPGPTVARPIKNTNVRPVVWPWDKTSDLCLAFTVTNVRVCADSERDVGGKGTLLHCPELSRTTMGGRAQAKPDAKWRTGGLGG